MPNTKWAARQTCIAFMLVEELKLLFILHSTKKDARTPDWALIVAVGSLYVPLSTRSVQARGRSFTFSVVCNNRSCTSVEALPKKPTLRIWLTSAQKKDNS